MTTLQIIIGGFSIGVGVFMAACGWALIPRNRKREDQERKGREELSELVKLHRQKVDALQDIAASLERMSNK